MTSIIEASGLSKTYGSVAAVSDVSFSLDGPGIHGLLGRNGAGKTTLMHLLTGQDFASAGTVRVFGESPVENANVLRRVCFIKESQTYPDQFKGEHVLKSAQWFFENWDAEYAAQLASEFKVPLNRRMKKMSRGQRSAVGVIVGLASRAELTLLDEPYAGLDAVARQLFYDRLLADFAEHPRTVLLSTHLIDEAAPLLERVLVIHDGRIVTDGDADELRASAVTLAGKASDVDKFGRGRPVLDASSLGGLKTITLEGLSPKDLTAAKRAGLEVSPVSLQQLIVRRTGGAPAREEVAS